MRGVARGKGAEKKGEEEEEEEEREKRERAVSYKQMTLRGGGVTEDVVFDPLIYDYIIQTIRSIDALRVSAAPGRGGIDISRMPPAAYMWDQLPDLHGYLTETIPESLRQGSVNITDFLCFRLLSAMYGCFCPLWAAAGGSFHLLATSVVFWLFLLSHTNV